MPQKAARSPGGSGNARTGSHLAETDAAEGRAESRWQRKRQNRLTPGGDGCRRRPRGAGGRSRWQRKHRNRLTPGSNVCRRGPCGMGGRSRWQRKRQNRLTPGSDESQRAQAETGTKNTVTPTGATMRIPKAKKASLLAERRPVSSRRSYFTICPDIWPLQAAALASSVSMCMARAYFSETRTTVSPKMSLRPVSCSTSTDTI